MPHMPTGTHRDLVLHGTDLTSDSSSVNKFIHTHTTKHGCILRIAKALLIVGRNCIWHIQNRWFVNKYMSQREAI